MEIVTKCEKERIGEGYNFSEAKEICADQEKSKESEASKRVEKEIPPENRKGKL